MVNAIRNKIRISLQEVFILTAAIALAASFALPALAVSSASLLISDTRPGPQTATYTLSLTGLSATEVEAIELELEAGAAGSFSNGSSTATTGTWDDDSSGTKLAATIGTAEALTDGDLVWTGVTNAAAGNYTATFTSYENSNYTSPVDTVTVNFAIVAGQQVSLTVDPAFSFTVDGVAASASVNGATTNVETTATTIPFGQSTVNLGTNGIAAQDLTINTNAQSGYDIFVRYTGALSNGSSDITDHPETNADPDAFSNPGTEAFGYTTDGLARFVTDNWAGFTTSNEPIAASATALTEPDETRVGFQVGIDGATNPGTYITTVIYTAVPKY